MKIIFALGNPGKEYVGTRHNVGYDFVHTFADEQGVEFTTKDRFKARVAECTINGEKLILVLPMTFYNNVGESFRAVNDFYKVAPSDVLVIHDELALPFGTIRVREGGSDAGNNGIKSINQHGGESTMRVRVGIANENRATYGDSDFVLSSFSNDEHETLSNSLYETLQKMINDFTSDIIAITSHKH